MENKEIADFLHGKTDYTLELFDHLVAQYQQLPGVMLSPTKSMIAFMAKTKFAYIIRLGKNFIDVVFPFTQPYADNLCFYKIAQVPGDSKQYNHHFRMYFKEDLNEEVKMFMKLAYQNGC